MLVAKGYVIGITAIPLALPYIPLRRRLTVENRHLFVTRGTYW